MSKYRVPRVIQKNLKSIKVWFFACILLYGVVSIFLREREHHESFDHFRKVHWEVSRVGVKDYPKAMNYERKDWHDYEFIKYEAGRKGPGEQGQGVTLTDPKDIELDKILQPIEGLHVVVSDKISVNRSIKDTRPRECQNLKYLKNLPSTTVIVIFHNEWLSILLRTIHAIYNRTPRELLKELILVNDNSTKPELNDQLESYVKENFDDRVKLTRLNSRHGLIVTRMEGAKLATGEVLVFLDAHMEVNVNWLPPLLEPIAMNPTTVTTPNIDSPNWDTFEYKYSSGVRGVYDQNMWYQWFPLRQRDRLNPYLPHQIPIMLGAAFAIRRDYFSDLGQYDEGLMIWNGEQMELSLKLHLCGGDLLEVPCSRISHIFRSHQRNHQVEGIDVAARNFKRIGEVWMDEFKEVMYREDPVRFSVDPGDLTVAKMVKERLNCKPFRYFLENIAPEMYTRYYYQLDYPGYFARGALRSEGSPENCLDFMDNYGAKVQIYKCNDKELKKPGWNQYFKLTWHHKIRLGHKENCLHDTLYLNFCHYGNGKEFQNWKYDINTKQIISEWQNRPCLTSNSKDFNVTLKPCNPNDIHQKWTWGNMNETALRLYDKIKYVDNQFFGFDN